MTTYLDNAATTPLDPRVLETMLPYLKVHYGNPSAQHAVGRETRAAIEQARKNIAGIIGAKASEIIFTSGGTEATNLALVCAVRDLGARRIITTPVEHHCVLHTTEYLRDHNGIELLHAPIDSKGRLITAELERMLADGSEPTLVSVMHANNETGILNDIEAIAGICAGSKAWFHSDTVQTMAHYRFDLSRLPVHFITGSAHKFHGPKGSGFLYARKGITVRPIIHGGGQERNKRAGTENVYGIVGMAKALELSYEGYEAEKEYVGQLRARLLSALKASFSGIRVNGSEDPQESLYTILNITFPPDPRGSLILFNLDMEGVCVSGGSACSSGASTGSHVLKAMGADPDGISIRFSFSRFNTAEDIDRAVEALEKVLARA